MSDSPEKLSRSLEQFLMRLMTESESDGLDTVAELDLPFSQVRLLFTLSHSTDPLPIHAIAGKLGLSVASAGRNVDALVRLGLAERREHPDDRRVKLVTVTAAGSQITSSHMDSKRATLREFAERLPADQRTRLHECLSDILAGPHLTAPDHTPTKETQA